MSVLGNLAIGQRIEVDSIHSCEGETLPVIVEKIDEQLGMALVSHINYPGEGEHITPDQIIVVRG